MRKIWVVLGGSDGDWPIAAVTSESYADPSLGVDLHEVRVFDRPIRTETHYSRWIEIRHGLAYNLFTPRETPGWPEWLDGWGEAVSRAEISHQPANRYTRKQARIWVQVEGNDSPSVDAEVERQIVELGARWGRQQVANGRDWAQGGM